MNIYSPWQSGVGYFQSNRELERHFHLFWPDVAMFNYQECVFVGALRHATY